MRGAKIPAEPCVERDMRTWLLLAWLALPALALAECPAHEGGVHVEGDRLRVEGPIRFDLYRAEIDAESMRTIDAVARRLIACPELSIEVQVHTDTRRTEQFNLRASALIAAQIRARLIAQGVPASRVAACGYGESRPLTDGGRQPWDPANTRVEWARIASAGAHACPLAQ